ncbi:hypothetical protein OH76DRAFT_1070310 [Lentinus brumalis]|uniref:Uncharacterized protein n=1 Tax=Lentinus brumalis TaxID=2498619 RepID=A0A371DNS6_9APHY|nr:hypothetical protein OH76DRAFT_1070310 [Polyporus brumalis]
MITGNLVAAVIAARRILSIMPQRTDADRCNAELRIAVCSVGRPGPLRSTQSAAAHGNARPTVALLIAISALASMLPALEGPLRKRDVSPRSTEGDMRACNAGI